MDNLEPITRNEMFLNGDDLEPITREEMILAGADLEPLTRHEWFLKKYRGSGDVTIKRLAVTENGTYSESGKAYSPVVVNVPAPPIPENAYLLNDLSDLPADIASFANGTDLPMASLKVAVTPYQDLHGYDAPWVGGAGKNKFDATTLMANVNSSVQYVTITLKPNTTYTMSTSLGKIDNVCNLFFMLPNESASSASNGVYSGLSISVTSGSDGQVKVGYRLPTDGTTVSQYLSKQYQIEEGSTATTYEPYSNICPIIGWDEAVVTVADDAESPTTSHEYTIDLNGTRYGGTLDATDGTFLDMIDHIASYNGEELPPAWISDRDVYAVGTTPTIGAEVVYPRATPVAVQLAPTPVKSLEGTNNIFANCGQITEVKYFKKA